MKLGYTVVNGFAVPHRCRNGIWEYRKDGRWRRSSSVHDASSIAELRLICRKNGIAYASTRAGVRKMIKRHRIDRSFIRDMTK